MDKRTLRKIQKQRLQAYHGEQREKEERYLKEKLFSSLAWYNAKVVAIVLSMPFEINTQDMIERGWQDEKKVVVPKIINGCMHFIEINPNTEYQLGSLHIKEPSSEVTFNQEKIDLIIVPGVAYTLRGERLGFGGGYYDRLLSQYTGQTIALALKIQLLDTIPVESHDQRVQEIIYI